MKSTTAMLLSGLEAEWEPGRLLFQQPALQGMLDADASACEVRSGVDASELLRAIAILSCRPDNGEPPCVSTIEHIAFLEMCEELLVRRHPAEAFLRQLAGRGIVDADQGCSKAKMFRDFAGLLRCHRYIQAPSDNFCDLA